MKTLLMGAAALSFAAAMSGTALAAPPPAAGTFLGGCAVTDILDPNANACAGFYAKNTLGGSPDMDAVTDAALAALGLDWDGTVLESIGLGDSDPTVDFATLLNGVTYIGIHWGKGQGPVDNEGGVTGYYRLDLAADAELDFFKTAFGSNSGARLYATNTCEGRGCGGGGNEVPEPSTWALMILGFGGAGAMLRRRKTVVA
jgi:hypothetical protein